VTGDLEGHRDPFRMLSPGDSMRCARQVKGSNPQGWISAREHRGMMLVEWGHTCYTAEAWIQFEHYLLGTGSRPVKVARLVQRDGAG
jgi:hypothetical protein